MATANGLATGRGDRVMHAVLDPRATRMSIKSERRTMRTYDPKEFIAKSKTNTLSILRI